MATSIGDLALLADGRTAALVAGDGNVVWLCWPRIDSMPCLLSLLDARRGGEFSVKPDGAAELIERGYLGDTLVLRTRWRTHTGVMVVDDALTDDLPPRLVRLVRAEEGSVAVRGRMRLAPDAARAESAVSVDGGRLTCSGGGTQVTVHAPADWELLADGAAQVRFTVSGAARAMVLTDPSAPPPPGDARELLQPTMDAARALRGRLQLDIDERGVASRVLTAEVAERLLVRSALVLNGLRQRGGGGIVAAPTTSLPQFPHTQRTWDYRYSWLRDTALAGLALTRLGMLDDARALAEFCASACADGEPRVLRRVDGGAPPEEATLDHLGGWQGARPVRIGNAAADQTQLDVLGEVLELAQALHERDPEALPDSLRAQVPRLAALAVQRWQRPDFGIWEIRGEPRAYTHSRLLAWKALCIAADLVDAGAASGDASEWRATAARIKRALMVEHTEPEGWFRLHNAGGGPDASLSQVVLLGLLPADDAHVGATLDAITTLSRGGLVDRYQGQPDDLGGSCAPFVFATFWFAQALERSGRDGSEPFRAACNTRGRFDLWGEVADPDDPGPLGNYPQVQSHAAFVLCATDPPR